MPATELALKLINEAFEKKSCFLDLGNCALNAIPEELLKLKDSLVHLNLGRFYYNDEKKEYIETANKLNRNSFNENEETFSLLTELVKLKRLDLYECYIGNDGVDFISQLSNLNSLDISSNKIGDKGADFISQLSNLNSLDISSNKIGEKGAEFISRLANLNSLIISSNNIGEKGAEFISRLSNLNSLDISSNKIGNKGAKFISRLSNLNSLDVSFNKIGDKDAEFISRLANLNSLIISYNNIGDKGAEFISRLANLNSLTIYSNNIGDKGAEFISRLANLNSLTISSNNIGDKGAEFISQLANLNSLAISSNNIGDKGAEFISRLANLNSLAISSNNIGDNGAEFISRLANLNSLEISSNNIGDNGAEFISRLANLNSLEISRNKIGDNGAEFISRLANLNSLEISMNKIGDNGAEFISRLANLNSLIISYNNIGDKGAEFISRLANLDSLEILNNNISHAIRFKYLGKLRHLGIRDNPLKDVPESIFEQYDCLENLRIWWKETENEKNVRPNEIVKLQVLGNGNAGKSSIVEAIKNEVCKIEFKSTHGIVIEPIRYLQNEEEISFHVWDFGGQEIYYGTHKLFISSQAIHLLIADDESEQYAIRQERIPDRDNKEELVLNQPLQHYINLSKRQSPKSSRIIVKNKIDKAAEVQNNNLTVIAEKNNLPIYLVSATNGTGIENLRTVLAEKRKDILHFGMLMPVSWIGVQEYFNANLGSPVMDRRRLMSMSKYHEICSRCNVPDISRQALLDFLHHTGIIYKNENLLKDVIITDQKWALDAIYKPLDRKSTFYDELRNDFKGRVRVKSLFKAFGDGYEPEQKWLFLNFMQSCGLCFPLNQRKEKETEDSYYIFPEFLPEEETPAVKELWETAADIRTYSCTPDFLDYYRIQQFIVALGHKTKVEYIWKKGILVNTEKGKFRVEAVSNKTIKISIELSATDDYLWLIIQTFKETESSQERPEWLADNGKAIDLESLEKRSMSREKASVKLTTRYAGHEESKGMEDSQFKKATNLKSALPDVEQSNPKRLVISFASENLDDLKAIEESLSNYELNGTIQVQYDDKVIDGRDSWDDDIKEMFLKADGFIMLVSQQYQNFKKHPYIWEEEIPIIKKRNHLDKIFAFCISVSPCNYNEILEKFAAFKNNKECLPEKGHQRQAYLADFAKEVIENKFLNINN